MEKTSKELLQFEHKDPSSLQESALLMLGKNKNVQQENPIPQGKPFTAPLPKSQVLGKVRDFLGVLSEANKNLELKAKDKPEDYNIEALTGNEAEYIEMDLMLGVADLHTPEAIAAAEAALTRNQPVLDLQSSSESEDSNEYEDDEDDGDKDEDKKAKESEMREDGPVIERSENRRKRKQPQIVELS